MRTERMNVRLDPDTNDLLRAAAARAGKTLTAFVLDAAREQARQVVDGAPAAYVQPSAAAAPAPLRAHVDV